MIEKEWEDKKEGKLWLVCKRNLKINKKKKEMRSICSRDFCTPGFFASLLTETTNYKPPKCLPSDERMRKI